MKSAAIISGIDPDSIASELDWQPGDEIVTINGKKLHDILDYRYFCADEDLEVVLKRGSELLEFEIEKDYEDSLGAQFSNPLFDGMHSCGANCMFCFVEQLPNGLRKSLYVKDDDYRLSFLDGCFVTLANVTQSDLKRIIQQRLSPLYVSVHATDHELRQKMLGRKTADIMQQLKTLVDGHISIHTQIVLCPGVNDGSVLERSLADLCSFYPSVESIAVVPVGLTGHRSGLQSLAPVDHDKAVEVIKQVDDCQRKCMEMYDSRLVWAADEFYLLAGRTIPGNSTYEGYPQLENGVGLIRQFLNGIPASRKMLNTQFSGSLNVTLLTGASASDLLTDWAKSINVTGLNLNVKTITNTILGQSITVAGLMCGKDILNQTNKMESTDLILIPDVAVRSGVFLDDVSLDDLRKALGCHVIAIEPSPQSAARTILEAAGC